MIKKLLEKYSNWVSSEEIEVLNHNLNYSNWTDTYACRGKWKIEVFNDEEPLKKLNIYMPTAGWEKPQSGYWGIYSGRVEIQGRVLLIWQDEKIPIRLDYLEIEDYLKLVIFGRNIKFEKE